MRATDAGLDEAVTILEEEGIGESDVDLKMAQEICKIQTR